MYMRNKCQQNHASLKSTFGYGACSWKRAPAELGLREKAAESIQ